MITKQMVGAIVKTEGGYGSDPGERLWWLRLGLVVKSDQILEYLKVEPKAFVINWI